MQSHDDRRAMPAPWKSALAITGFVFVGTWFFTLRRWFNDEGLTPGEGFRTQAGFSVLLLGLVGLVGFAIWWAQRGWQAEGWSPIVVSRMLLAPAAIAAIAWLISTR